MRTAGGGENFSVPRGTGFYHLGNEETSKLMRLLVITRKTETVTVTHELTRISHSERPEVIFSRHDQQLQKSGDQAMIKNIIRFSLIVALLGIALLTVEVGPKTHSQHLEVVELDSFAWGVSSQQSMRVCIGNGVTAAEPTATEQISLSFVAIKFEFGETVLERELQVPVGQFRCTDFSYQSLVAAGVVPQSNGALQFFVSLRTQTSKRTVGATQAITVGAVQSIDVSTGEIKLHQPFRFSQTRQTTVIQDL